jgi:serine/threonine-protein kinase SRPK3
VGARKDSFEDEADLQGRAIMSPPATELPATEGVIQLPNPRSIQETLARGLWYVDMYSRLKEEIHRDIPEDEIKIFADLLGKILKYNPSDRLTADATQDHEWFKM